MAADERQMAQESTEDEFVFPDEDTELEPEENGEQEDDGTQGEDGGQPAQKPAPEPFKLSDDVASDRGDTTPGKDDDLVKIVHRGRVHMVTKEKAVELAQKGFDYDVKVGPHSRLARIVESDPQLAQEIDQAIRRRMQGQNPQQSQAPDDPFKGLDDDEPLTVAEVKKAMEIQQNQMREQFQNNPQAMMRQQQTQAGNQIEMSLMARDPQNFRKVQPYLGQYAQMLSKQDYDRVNSDPAALYQFYDYVRNQVVKGQEQPQPHRQNPRNPGGSFRARSGSGNPTAGRTDEQKIWEMPNKDFEQQLAKIKGYA